MRLRELISNHCLSMKIRMASLISILIISCSSYKDSKLSERLFDQGLTIYKDYNLFRYKANYNLTMDKEVIMPVSFEIRLPKRMKYYKAIGSSDFAFYYVKNQVVFVKTGLKDSVAENKIYEPSSKELGDLIQNQLVTDGGRYDIKEIAPDFKNKSVIVRMGNTLVLLYNIRKEDIEPYVSLITTFKFL